MSPERERQADPEIEDLLACATFADDQHDVYRLLRERAPVYWTPASQQWLVTSFDLVDQVLTDPASFSSVGAEMRHIDALDDTTKIDTPNLCSHFSVPQMNIADPPEHTRIRRAFSRLFLRRRIDTLRPRITEIASELVERALTQGDDVEVMRDLAGPLPVQVIAEIMGLPADQGERITEVTMAQRYFFGVAPQRVHALQLDTTLREWHDMLLSLMSHRRRVPQDDVISAAASLVDDEVLTEQEAVATCLHLIIAGNSTTTALIGNVVYLLLSHPVQLDLLRSRPELSSTAVEEALRFEAPLPRDRRIATRATTVGGMRIEAGDRVSCVLSAACRDPAQFADPDVFDISRRFNQRQQAAFGRGIHLCVGAPVARLEAIVAVETLLRLVPQASIPSGFEPTWHDVPSHRALASLPVATDA